MTEQQEPHLGGCAQCVPRQQVLPVVCFANIHTHAEWTCVTCTFSNLVKKRKKALQKSFWVEKPVVFCIRNESLIRSLLHPWKLEECLRTVGAQCIFGKSHPIRILKSAPWEWGQNTINIYVCFLNINSANCYWVSTWAAKSWQCIW